MPLSWNPSKKQTSPNSPVRIVEVRPGSGSQPSGLIGAIPLPHANFFCELLYIQTCNNRKRLDIAIGSALTI
jgi:hypothetical protein